MKTLALIISVLSTFFGVGLVMSTAIPDGSSKYTAEDTYSFLSFLINADTTRFSYEWQQSMHGRLEKESSGIYRLYTDNFGVDTLKFRSRTVCEPEMNGKIKLSSQTDTLLHFFIIPTSYPTTKVFFDEYGVAPITGKSEFRLGVRHSPYIDMQNTLASFRSKSLEYIWDCTFVAPESGGLEISLPWAKDDKAVDSLINYLISNHYDGDYIMITDSVIDWMGKSYHLNSGDKAFPIEDFLQYL